MVESEVALHPLLYPRKKVILDYPNSEYEVGRIIHFPEKSTFYTGKPEWESEPITGKNGGRHMRSIIFFNPFPHIFQDLQWWEDRKKEEMPEYLKFDERSSFGSINGDTEPEVHKVKRHWATDTHFRFSTTECFVSEWHDKSYSYNGFIPATKEEYERLSI